MARSELPHDGDIAGLDPELAGTSTDILRDLAERGRNDLFFFAKAIFGNKDMTVRCHGPLCNFLDLNPSRLKGVLKPRGTFKSGVVTIAGGAQRVVKNPEHSSLILNEVVDNAIDFLTEIKSNAETNPIFRTLYGSVIPKNFKMVTWSNEELTFNRQGHYRNATITAKGMTTALTSHHYDHLGIDDPISEAAAKSAPVMQDAINVLRKVKGLMVHPMKSTMTVVGTPWGLSDVYTHFRETYRDQMAWYVRPIIDDTGELIFPERIDMEELMRIREEFGEFHYSCQFLLQPRNSAVQDFNIQDLRMWRWSRDGERVVLLNKDNTVKDVVPLGALDVTVCVDLAASETAKSDFNAITTCGATVGGDIIVLDVFNKRCTPTELMDELIRLNKRFHPRVFGIEDVGYQKSFKWHLRAEADRQQVYFNIVPIKALGKKALRIRGLQPVAATGHLYILPTQTVLRDQLLKFPLNIDSQGEFDDVIDSLSMHLQVWQGAVSEERWTKYREAETRLAKRVDGYDLRGGSGKLRGVHDFDHSDGAEDEMDADETPRIETVTFK